MNGAKSYTLHTLTRRLLPQKQSSRQKSCRKCCASAAVVVAAQGGKSLGGRQPHNMCGAEQKESTLRAARLSVVAQILHMPLVCCSSLGVQSDACNHWASNPMHAIRQTAVRSGTDSVTLSGFAASLLFSAPSPKVRFGAHYWVGHPCTGDGRHLCVTNVRARQTSNDIMHMPRHPVARLIRHPAPQASMQGRWTPCMGRMYAMRAPHVQ